MKVDLSVRKVLALYREGQGDALEALKANREFRTTLADAELLAVKQARLDGHPWGKIAKALGVSRQAAHAKYGHFDRYV